jgi:lysozyme
MNMTYSKSGRALTERFEGCRLVAYPDSTGVWTLGYGRTRGVVPRQCCTQEQADQWLVEDTDAAVAYVNHHVTTTITQEIFDALVDFTFNLGDGTLLHSALLALVNERKFAEAAQEFDKYDHAGGKVVAGLLRRRQAEEAEFNAAA